MELLARGKFPDIMINKLNWLFAISGWFMLK